MEDAHIATGIKLPSGESGMLFGVFDGHGGKEVAEYTKLHFQRILEDNSNFKKEKYGPALIEAFLELDANVK